jgi:predicted dehydrogenase
MSDRLRVGVIGLGKRWRRYRAVLAAVPLRVQAVCDTSPRRAIHEAQRLHCEAVEGTEELLERNDIEAILLFDSCWQGLWPLERAARAGRPVFTATTGNGEACLENERGTRSDHTVPVMAGVDAAITPAISRLRLLLDKHLGPPRVVCGTRGVGRTVSGEKLLSSSALLPGLEICRALFSAPPETVWAAVPRDAGVVSLTLAYPDGQAACVTVMAGQRSSWKVTVTSERGLAEATLPRRLRWRDAAGEHSLRLSGEPTRVLALSSFADAVRNRRPATPTLEDAFRTRSWLHAARQSQAAGGPVHLG